MPGLMNHLTTTLDKIEVGDGSEGESSLLETIRVPRNLGMIRNNLPDAQFNPVRRIQSDQIISKEAIEN